MSFELEHDDEVASLSVAGVLGVHQFYPVLAGAAAGVARGIDLAAAAAAVSTHEYRPGRMRILDGIRESVIIDDSYNASPVAADQALALLESLDVAGRRIAILGDMLTLGRFAEEANFKLGRRAARACDQLLAVGRYADVIATGAIQASMHERFIHRLEDAGAACEQVERMIEPHDVVLVEGSHGVRLDGVIERITPPRRGEIKRGLDLGPTAGV